MTSVMAPNVSGVDAPGRRTVYSMCGMCAVRCPLGVTVEDGRVTWLQGNPHDVALGTSLCAKGSAGLAFEFDDQRPQSPLIRTGPRGGGRWRRVSWDEALDYIADKLHETIETFGGRDIALSDRSGPFIDLTRTFLGALGSPNYFSHDASCGGNVYNAARSIYGFGHEGLSRGIAKPPGCDPSVVLAPLWQHFWNLPRPDGPSAALFLDFVADLGYEAVTESETRPVNRPTTGVDYVAFVRRRLCLPESRDPEIAAALSRCPHGDHVGRRCLGPASQ